jgi:NAD+ synthase (glutamine-hydrolysing)
MTDRLRILMAQINPVVGDILGNAHRILAAFDEARQQDAALVVFPELTVTGYPPEDLLLRQDFLDQVDIALIQIRNASHGLTAIVGFPQRCNGHLYNSAAVFQDGELVEVYQKQWLPNYGVFDEKRYFSEGKSSGLAHVAGIRIGITICEDIWHEGPAEHSVGAGADLIVSLNASPFHTGKLLDRHQLVKARIDAIKTPLLYVNLVGGQDELVFDGGSFAMDDKGKLLFHAPEFREHLGLIEIETKPRATLLPATIHTPLDEDARIYEALVLGIRDYARKNGFKGAVLGLSGGIDSALTLALAADALGPEQVEAVLMPSRYTADMSNEDAYEQAEALGCKTHTIPIEPAFDSFLDLLAPVFKDLPNDLTEENIQARCRGILLMAISNKKGKILLTTGNKSEMSVGYATLYGDMAGGFAPLKDIPKLLVYRLARYRNTRQPVIPERVLVRPPSAELRPDQRDEDSLPPYPILDDILERYIERDQSIADIIAAGLPEHDVKRVTRMVDRNEYKRRQAPPGVKVTTRAFGRDRRYPMTHGFSH